MCSYKYRGYMKGALMYANRCAPFHRAEAATLLRALAEYRD